MNRKENYLRKLMIFQVTSWFLLVNLNLSKWQWQKCEKPGSRFPGFLRHTRFLLAIKTTSGYITVITATIRLKFMTALASSFEKWIVLTN
jgi:hypothetical protein